MSRMLEIDGLVKNFGPLTAVDHVSFHLDRGEVLGFLGPNGAGKSTTMKVITGFLPASKGTARVCGYDVGEQPIDVKKRIGYLPEGAPLYEDMTPGELLAFVARLRGLAGDAGSRAIDLAVERAAIGTVMYQPIGTLSKGFKRRVGLAQAILHDPEVLILDEPTDGLDPNQKHEVRELISAMAAEKAIIISTHILEEVEAVCTRAIIIDRGKIVADGTPAELQGRSTYHNAVRLNVSTEEAEKICASLEGLDIVARVDRMPARDGVQCLTAVSSGGAMILDQVRRTVSDAGISPSEIGVEAGRLDDVFRQITYGDH